MNKDIHRLLSNSSRPGRTILEPIRRSQSEFLANTPRSTFGGAYTLASFFAVLAVFISCLGLFGLASFVAEQRTREIGVRKVLGASTINLWGLLSKDFIGLVVLSNMIAAPIAWLILHQWLQQYEYRTPIYWWIFALSGLGALLMTLLTVSHQTLKAALMNPVKSLRSEG